MRMHIVAFCSLLMAGCASQPAAPVAFHAPMLTDESADAAPDGEPLALEGVPDTAAGSAAVAHAQSADVDDLTDRHVTALLGWRKVHDNDADDLDIDDQLTLGVGIDMSDPDTGNGFEAGLEGSGNDGHAGGHDVDSKLYDLYAGYRKTFHPENNGADSDLHPYLAGGLALVHGELDVGPHDDDDTTLGAYIRAGVSFDVGEKSRLGLDYRHMWAHLDGFDADFDQLAVTLGFPF